RPATVAQPLRTTRACTSWPCDCEHRSISSAHGPEWPTIGDSCRDFVGDCILSSPPILLIPICAPSLISKTEPRHAFGPSCAAPRQQARCCLRACPRTADGECIGDHRGAKFTSVYALDPSKSL